MTAASSLSMAPKFGAAGPLPSGLMPASTSTLVAPKSRRWLLPPTSPAPPSALNESVGLGLARPPFRLPFWGGSAGFCAGGGGGGGGGFFSSPAGVLGLGGGGGRGGRGR